MKTRDAILLTIALWILASIIRFNFWDREVSLVPFMVVGTALWIAIDSSRIQLRRYKSGIAYGPVVLFFAVSLLWIVGFPWYLVMRGKIKNGTATLKDQSADVPA
jgi:hypothetical protein